MGENSQEPEMKPVWKDYYEILYDEIGLCQRQALAALQARRFGKAEKFEINGKRASFEEMREASDILVDKKQEPRHDVRLLKQSSYVIKADIIHAERLLKKLKEVLTGIRIPARPPEVDEWMER